MPGPERWSPAMDRAWQYALSAINEGMSGAAGQRAYRAGGGEIRDKDWDQLIRWAKDHYTRQEVAEDFWRAVDLPEGVYTPSNYQFRQSHKATSWVRYWNPQTKQYERHWYSVLDDHSKSREQWASQLDIALQRYGEFQEAGTVTIMRTVFEKSV